MMVSMRVALSAAVLTAAATAAAAQPTLQLQLDDLRVQQEAAQRRAVDQSNQLMALDARLRAEQASADLQRRAAPVPELRYEPSTRGTATTSARFPSIPDSALADSNRRVQDAAAGNRR